MTLDLVAVVKQAVREVLREERQAAPAETVDDGYLQLQHAAAFADVSPSTIKEWRRQGLKVHGKGRVRLVEKAELRRYIEREQQPARPAEVQKERVARILASVKGGH